MEFILLILVGPSDLDLMRLEKLLASVFRYGKRIAEVVLVDNTTDGRSLQEKVLVPAGVKVTSLIHERRGVDPAEVGAGCWGLLQGLRYISTLPGRRSVIKLDTDALAISPFEERLEALLQTNPEVGTAGVVEWNCDGSRREWEPFGTVTQNLAKLLRWRRNVLLPRRIAFFGRWALYRRVMLRARRHGYRWGEHSQGGCYLISSELIERMRRAGDLETGPQWHFLYMGEDILMGFYALACGLKNVHFGRRGEVFGSAHYGLPLPPWEMRRRGYGFVHTLKNDTRFSENEIRRYFESEPTQPVGPGEE